MYTILIHNGCLLHGCVRNISLQVLYNMTMSSLHVDSDANIMRLVINAIYLKLSPLTVGMEHPAVRPSGCRWHLVTVVKGLAGLFSSSSFNSYVFVLFIYL